jgi:hypothetical protein
MSNDERGEAAWPNDDEHEIREELRLGHIDFTDAVIRLTALIDDCDKAQAMVAQWEADLDDGPA